MSKLVSHVTNQEFQARSALGQSLCSVHPGYIRIHCQLHIRTVDMAKGASLLLRYNGIDHISCCSCSLSDCKLNAIQTYTISPIPALKTETCENPSLLQSYQKNL